jgi:hypothetical protein
MLGDRTPARPDTHPGISDPSLDVDQAYPWLHGRPGCHTGLVILVIAATPIRLQLGRPALPHVAGIERELGGERHACAQPKGVEIIAWV